MTGKIVCATITAVALLCSAAWAQAAGTATTAGPAKIGIINMQDAIVACNEGQRDFGALQKKFEPKRDDIKRLNDEVDGLQKQLDTQGDKLNDEARAKLVKEIADKKKSLQRVYEDATAEFQAQQGELANKIGSKMLEVLNKYGEANGYSVILDVSTQNSPVLWAPATTNITPQIVEQYNTISGVPAQAPPAGAAKPGASAGTKPAPPKPAPTTPKH